VQPVTGFQVDSVHSILEFLAILSPSKVYHKIILLRQKSRDLLDGDFAGAESSVSALQIGGQFNLLFTIDNGSTLLTTGLQLGN